MAPRNPCAVCLDLDTSLPQELSRWRTNVAENLAIEYILSFDVAALSAASEKCSFCAVIENGLESIHCGVFHDECGTSCLGFRRKKGRIILQDASPLEIELFDDDSDDEEVPMRLQFFATNGDGKSGAVEVGGSAISGLSTYNLSAGNVFGNARDVPSLITLESHISLIKSWINDCIDHHSSCNIAASKLLPSRLLEISHSPDYVVLVDTAPLATTKNISYATLSHCWGTKRFIRTTLSTLSEFKSGFSWATLPRTFQDAIQVAKALGLNYIWIDSICIIQDSLKDWVRESTLMASIYSNSYLNIAATRASDTTLGCLSPRSQTCRSVPIAMRLFQGEQRALQNIFVRRSLTNLHKFYTTPVNSRSETLMWEEERKQAPLLDRAWIFQERYLAPRTLHFCSSELVMECRNGMRCECTGLDVISSNPLRNEDDVSYDSWFSVVEEFSRLRLTFESDRLIALIGVADKFHAKLSSSYLQGIWAMDLVRGLLWQTMGFEPRQTNKPASMPERQAKHVASTWSWASMILPEGMGIIFPAATDSLFSSSGKFRLLGVPVLQYTKPSTQISHQTSSICVHAEVVQVGIAFNTMTTGSHGSVLVFDHDIDDTVMITALPFSFDVLPENLLSAESWEIRCLILGLGAEFDDYDEKHEIYNTLVVRAVDGEQREWERIGVIDILKSLIPFQIIEEYNYILV
jgi:hypothetical protein